MNRSACPHCQEVDRDLEIRTPAELARAIRVIRDNLADGTLRESQYWPDDVLGLAKRCPFTEFADRRPRGDVVECYFECPKCARLYHLSVETYHGSGGRWCAVDDRDAPQPGRSQRGSEGGRVDMIRFANPRKETSAGGRNVLILTEAGTWASFPGFAERYVRQIGALVVARVEGPDVHLWEIEYDGCKLRLVYDDFPNGISLEPMGAGGRGAIDALYELALSESDPLGW